MKDFSDKLKNLPKKPGVYLMRDNEGRIIYVGKAKVLKNRISQYFQKSAAHSPKTLSMIVNIDDFDYIITETEVEALILECHLIKRHKPKYNILLKDDKHFPYIKITKNEEFPRILITRKHEKDGARYFGPFMSGFAVKDNVEILRKIFKIRTCTKVFPRDLGKGRPCLMYHINQCGAPCARKISAREYNENIAQATMILEGKFTDITASLQEQMQAASDNLEFERAARIRDKIKHIQTLGEKQKITSTQEDNRDILGFFQADDAVCVQIFYMRNGKVAGAEYFVFDNAENADSCEVFSQFVRQFYFNLTNIPKEILLPCELNDMEVFEQFVSEKAGHRIYVSVPKRGDKARLVKMAIENAEESYRRHKFTRDKEETDQNDALAGLMEVLSLPAPPFRIESYDISNISGEKSVGACVVYQNAMPQRKNYRKFNIKTVAGADDYASMREVVYRRIHRAYDEQDKIAAGELTPELAKFLPLPDLILLDGGKGHVAVIKELLATMGEEIPVFGMVKDDKHRTRGLTSETTEFDIPRDSETFRFLTRLQDEVHRFAITAYRKRHEGDMVHSELEDIPNVGAATRRRLLTHFSNVERIKSATLDELCEIINKRAAQSVYDFFRKNAE